MKVVWICEDCGKSFETWREALDCQVGIDPANESSHDLASDKWYNPVEAAKYLGISGSGLRKWLARRGKIFGHMLDLEDREDRYEYDLLDLDVPHHNVRFLIPERDLIAAKDAMEALGHNLRSWAYQGPIYHYDGGTFLYWREEREE